MQAGAGIARRITIVPPTRTGALVLSRAISLVSSGLAPWLTMIAKTAAVETATTYSPIAAAPSLRGTTNVHAMPKNHDASCPPASARTFRTRRPEPAATVEGAVVAATSMATSYTRSVNAPHRAVAMVRLGAQAGQDGGL